MDQVVIDPDPGTGCNQYPPLQLHRVRFFDCSLKRLKFFIQAPEQKNCKDPAGKIDPPG